MVVVPELERGLRDANVGHSLAGACDFSVVDEIGRQAVPLEWAEVLVPAVASFTVRFLVFFHGLLVVSFDDAGDVRHAAITYFECVFVEDAVEFHLSIYISNVNEILFTLF